ncbi:hypothetical protein EYZ11_008631 [Aspergillus tanneri]|uniref:Uncharacterized protein n=1 Tax=Aspergillus tanneri TaxID=1220188 RepID=A0A4S3JFF5_9EURO|nr:hypothetical protein EYZ11_008631 [Aspergillus tanneri]
MPGLLLEERIVGAADVIVLTSKRIESVAHVTESNVVSGVRHPYYSATMEVSVIPAR